MRRRLVAVKVGHESMAGYRTIIIDYVMSILQSYLPGHAGLVMKLLIVLWILISAALLHLVLHRIVVRILSRSYLVDRKGSWLNAFHENNLLQHLLLIFQSAFVQIQVKAWLDETTLSARVLNGLSELLVLFFLLMSLFAALNAFQNIASFRASRLHAPIRGAIQTAKLVLSVLFGLIAIATVLEKSILALLSGVGALSAVLMLVFRDPILGLAAGIQLSINDMLVIGDWIEMPKYDADGDVIDIGLTTVKVQNWDKTITTIPTYALISDSFRNWRGMSASGGRRIKRSLLINTASIKFLESEDIERLRRSRLLVSYIEEKRDSLEKENAELEDDMSCKINGRRLTNLGTFRQYLLSYLKAHPSTRKDMTLMVRQLASTSKGLPLEIYAFANTTVWTAYEDIQSDIFDHVFAVLGEFELRIHEAPIGEDIKQLRAG